jgi:oligosaccharyl transferase (archaeosortase A-associated)
MEPKFRLSPPLLAGIFVSAFFLVALYFRIYLPYDRVFGENWVKLVDTDSYYHLRLVENLLSNSFHRITFDPFTYFPHGSTVSWPIFFDWLLAGIIWLIGLGSPTQNVINVVGVYYPAVLGALIIIPVYFIGKVLFNRWVGVIAAGLVAIMPTGLLLRSRLGDIDHHVAESLFVTVIVLFLILAIKASKQRALSFGHIMHGDWKHIGKPLFYSLLAGIFIGIYLLTWVGGLFFVFCIFLFILVLSVIDHLKGDSTDYIAIIGSVSMSVGTLIALPLLPTSWLSPLFLPSFAIAVLTPLVVGGISSWMKKRAFPKIYFLLTLLSFGIIGVMLFYVINPSLLESMLGQFDIFWKTGAALSISEVQPILVSQGHFSLDIVWSNFTTGCFLAIIGLGLLIHAILKRADADKVLFLIWTLVMLVATLAQRRFGYYFAVNVALLSGYVAWNILRLFGFGEPRIHRFKIQYNPVFKVAGIIVVFFLVFFPNIMPAINLAKSTTNIENDAWFSALVWLREYSPEPFGNPDFYYDYYDAPPRGKDYAYPDTAYGVIAPWSKGHEITLISRRLPVANPFQQGAGAISNYFASQGEASGNKLMDELRARYVMVDRGMTTTRFSSTIAFGNNEVTDFYEVFYQLKDGKLSAFNFYYPEYYRSMVVRLFTFDGQEFTPQECRVISYEEKTNKDGSTYKQLVNIYKFPSYEEASAFVTKQKSGNYRIGNTDTAKSPVYLAKLEHYKVIYRYNIDGVPELKTFYYQ